MFTRSNVSTICLLVLFSERLRLFRCCCCRAHLHGPVRSVCVARVSVCLVVANCEVVLFTMQTFRSGTLFRFVDLGTAMPTRGESSKSKPCGLSNEGLRLRCTDFDFVVVLFGLTITEFIFGFSARFSYGPSISDK